jgi:hypothetical protein
MAPESSFADGREGVGWIPVPIAGRFVETKVRCRRAVHAVQSVAALPVPSCRRPDSRARSSPPGEGSASRTENAGPRHHL